MTCAAGTGGIVKRPEESSLRTIWLVAIIITKVGVLHTLLGVLQLYSLALWNSVPEFRGTEMNVIDRE